MLSAEAYMTMMFTDYGATRTEKEDFGKRFYNRDAVWLDFTSFLCRSVEEVIKHLPFCLATTRKEKPVVLTLLNARDSYHGSDSRVARIVELQPAFKYENHWTYTGKNGSSMVTVCGTIV